MASVVQGPPAPPVPGQPHPDVKIVEAILSEVPPGGTIAYTEIGKAIGVADLQIIQRRERTARNRLLYQGVHFEAVPGVGLTRLTSLQTLARHQGRERRGMSRKARKAGRALGTVKVEELQPDERLGYYVERTLTNVVYQATQATSAKKMLVAVKANEAYLPMAKALEVLSNGDK